MTASIIQALFLLQRVVGVSAADHKALDKALIENESGTKATAAE